jgi:hypothetical protein
VGRGSGERGCCPTRNVARYELVPDKRLLIASQPITYQHMYEKAYGDKVKSKRKSSALTGGLLGTATVLVIHLSATGGDY